MKDEMLLAWVDGDLDQAGRARVSEHIVGCVECHRTIDELKEVTGALGKWTTPEPEALPTARELLDRAGVPPSAAPGAAGWRDWIRRYGAVAGIVLFAAVAGLVIVPRYTSKDVSVVTVPGETASSKSAPAGNGYLGAPASNAAIPPATQSDGAGTTPGGTAAPDANVTETAPSTDEEPAKKLDDGVVTTDGPAPTDADLAKAPATEEVEVTAAEPPSPAPPPVSQPQTAAGGESAASRDNGRDAKTGAIGGYRAAPKPAGRAASRREAESAVVHRADVTMAGGQASDIADRVAAVARSENGSVSKRWSRSKEKDSETVTVELSVPAENFEQTISRLRSVGNVQSVRRSAIDLSGRIAEIDGELEDERKNEDASTARKQKAPSKDSLQRERQSLAARADRAVITVTIVGKP